MTEEAPDNAGEAGKRRERHQRATAAASGALLGAVLAGPLGIALAAGLGPVLEPLVEGVWAELAEAVKRRHLRTLESTVEAGIPPEELGERINASERTQLLTGSALSGAGRTAWEDKLRTLGRSLASGLLAGDDAKIDVEQMIIAAITDIEGPQLAMLELLVAWRPGRNVAEPQVAGPFDLPKDSHGRPLDGNWDVAWREWSREQIAHARPSLAPLAPSLLGTLQRHGLAVQNDMTGEALEKYGRELEIKQGEQYAREGRGGAFRPSSVARVPNPARLVPEPTWSPTGLGEKVYLRFRDAGTKLEDVWTSGPANQQE